MPTTGKAMGIVGAVAAAIAAFIAVLTFTTSQIDSVETKLGQRITSCEEVQRDSEAAISEFRADMKWVKRSLERIEQKIDDNGRKR